MVIGLLIYMRAGPWLPADRPHQPAVAGEKVKKFEPGDGLRIFAIVLLIPSLAVSLLPNQEMQNAYMVWADQHFDLTIGGFRMPTTWLVTYDSIVSFFTLLGITAFWQWRGSHGKWEPDEIGKLIIGSVFTVAGALCLYIAAITQGSGKIGLFWPALFHILNDIGFGHSLPVSLALVSRLAPRKLTATAIGLYYLSFFLANKIVGEVGGWYSTMDIGQFWLVHVGAAVAGLVFFVVFKLFASGLFEDKAREGDAVAA
jgi:POT family proton-dependent oligopeptide transporter